MNLSTYIYFTFVVLTFALTGYLAWYAWRQEPRPGMRPYAWLAFCECLLALTEILSMVSRTQAQALFWFDLRFVFTALIPVLWLAFSLAYGGRAGWLSKKVLAGLLVIPVLTQVMAWTNPWLGLWLKHDVDFQRSGPFWIVQTSARLPAVWFYVHNFYSLALLVAGMGAILWSAWRLRRQNLWQALLLSAGALVVLITSLIPSFNLFPQMAFNPFVPGIGVSQLLIALAVFRFQLLKHSPESAEKIVSLRDREQRSLAVFVLIFILFAIGIAAIGILSYQRYESQYRLQVSEQLSAIAKLKVDQIQSWRAERLGDAHMINQNPAFLALVQQYDADPADAQAQAQLQTWLDILRNSYHYSRVSLLDTHAVEQVSSPANAQPVGAYLAGQAAAALGLGQVNFVDFYRDTPGGPIYLALLAPIYAGGDHKRPLGVVALKIDPQGSLYPFIQEWPIASSTAETLIVRQDGNNVLFLNQLRFEQNTALNLRIPLTDTQVLAVKAILGQTGMAQGEDYRDVPVIGYVGPVPGSPWFLVARMDTSEVDAPLRERLWQIILFYGLLLLAAGSGLLLIWRQRGVRHFRAELASLEALRLSEEKYRNLFDNAEVGMYRSRLDGSEFLDVNEKFLKILGRPRSEVQGAPSVSFWADPQERAELVRRLQAEGHVTDFELGILNKQGQLRLCLLSARLYPQDAILEGSIQDITERKLAEARLAQLAAIVDSSEDAIIGKTLDGTITSWNAGAEHLYGYSVAEAVGKPISLITPPDLINELPEILDRVSRGEIIHHYETARQRKDGNCMDVSISVSPIKDTAGHIIGASTITRDITDRKQAEETLRRSEERFRSLFENMLNGFAYCQMIYIEGQAYDFIYLDVNRAFETLTGLKDVVGKKVSEVIPGIQTSDRELIERYGRVALTGQPESFEIYLDALKMWFSISVYSPQKGYFVAVFDVITERKRAEHELQQYSEHLAELVEERTRALRQAQEKLVRQERLATLGQLAGSVGHELRNPLGVISNAVYFLKMTQAEASETILDYLDIIEKETHRADKIVTDLLDFTRVKTIEREPVDLSAVARQAFERYHVPPTIEVHLEIPASLPQLYADPNHVVQVLGNLITNACQAMSTPDGVPLAGKLTLSASLQSDMIAITVQDVGVGIPPENMGRLFEPLFTTKIKGIGLGLAVSQKLVEANGGRIEARSELGKGSSFTVYLPVFHSS